MTFDALRALPAVLVFVLLLGAAPAAPLAQAPAAPPSAEPSELDRLRAMAAREKIGNVLASDRIDQILYEVESHEEANELLFATADALIGDGPVLGEEGDEHVARIMAVIEALNDVEINLDQRLIYGEDRMTIRNLEQAEAFATMINDVLAIIDRGASGAVRPVSYEESAEKVFHEILAEVGTGVPVVLQYARRVRDVANKPDRHLTKYVVFQ